jgi:adsorption protein B
MEERNGTPFATNSLTEDYDLGLGLTVQGRPTRYLHQYVQIDENDKGSEELIATWAPFPQTFRTAVRQRTRWMAGIVFQGWEHWGWPQGLSWLLAHDRRGPLGYLVVLAGYLLLIYFVGYEWTRVFYDRSLPEMLDEPWFAWLFWIGLFFMGNRLAQRAISTGKLYGVGQGLLSIFRTPFSNIVNMVATFRAANQYFKSRRTGIPMSWDKTEHSLPPQVGAQMRLGERLIEEKKLTTQQLMLALKQQREQGGQLGAILVKQGAVSRDDVETVVRNTRS